MRALILLVFFVGCGAAPAPRVSTEGDDARLLDRLAAAPPPAEWALVGKTPLDFATYHPQGLLRLGDRWLLTTVEIRRAPSAGDPGEGTGHLIAFDDNGHELARVTLGEGKAFHPGGFDLDGETLLVPVAEYRPDSATIVYRVDPQTLAATEAFRVADHIGAIAVDRLDGTVYGMSWGSRRIYAWDHDGRALGRRLNRAFYIDLQDCGGLPGTHLAVCGGVRKYQPPGAERPLRFGGIEVLDLPRGDAALQWPIERYSDAPEPKALTRNALHCEVRESALDCAFVPDDAPSVLYRLRAALPLDNRPTMDHVPPVTSR